MYAAGAEVNAKQANYYMPAQHEDEAPPSKKMCESVPRPPAMHILGRRYALTATAYKYLNIGISVGAEPVIDIVIDDNRGKQLLLPIKTWNALMGQRADIQRFLQANFYKSSYPPMRIEELTITSCKMYNSQIIR
ncbi:uncharacterized protein LOC112588702 [Harpegnathos saltator]|uniref:uncharacterized protein LOC112588702 n=1 Tax=Harpegnathos saltator TaxID=610380 RepID=UPI000DBED4FA|nr:uncharacterized protein LOC112588702 [Harpegnathos saltator]